MFFLRIIAGSQLDDLGGAGGTGYPQVTGFIGFDDTGHRAIHRDRFGHGPVFQDQDRFARRNKHFVADDRHAVFQCTFRTFDEAERFRIEIEFVYACIVADISRPAYYGHMRRHGKSGQVAFAELASALECPGIGLDEDAVVSAVLADDVSLTVGNEHILPHIAQLGTVHPPVGIVD